MHSRLWKQSKNVQSLRRREAKYFSSKPRTNLFERTVPTTVKPGLYFPILGLSCIQVSDLEEQRSSTLGWHHSCFWGGWSITQKKYIIETQGTHGLFRPTTLQDILLKWLKLSYHSFKRLVLQKFQSMHLRRLWFYIFLLLSWANMSLIYTYTPMWRQKGFKHLIARQNFKNKWKWLCIQMY